MDNKRAQTLEALSTYIQTQKKILAGTQFDIDRLRKLKNEAITEPAYFLSNLSYELNTSAFKISEQLECASGPPEEIDWSLYTSQDSSSLQTLAVTSRLEYAQRNQPSLHQGSEMSDLQKFVKESRRTILDPVFSRLPTEYSSDEEVFADPEDLLRERERAKIRELKKRKIACGLTIPLHARGANGVFIRRDLEDESGEVDISFEKDNVSCAVQPSSGIAVGADIPLTSLPSTAQPNPPPTAMAVTKSTRARRPTIKLESFGPHRNSRHLSKQTLLKSEPEPDRPPPAKVVLGKRTQDGKPRPETYKLPWSVSEQHLLERLLDEIPEGEKNRWQKISRAMNGRRTPKQVASRVQKYFEKLKLFGIEGK